MTKRRDLIETLTNTCGGFVLAYLVALWVFPFIGIPMDMTTAGLATAVMWCVSTARLYVLRRIFRWLEHRGTT